MRNSQRAQAIIEKEPILEKAVDELRKITQSEIEQAWAESRYKYEVDEIAFRLTAEDEGRAEGLAEGRKEGRKEGIEETALKMMNKGLDSLLIQEVTGLSNEEIERLKKKSNTQ